MPIASFAAYQRIQALQHHERYQAAFIFGSMARGDYTVSSDFDVVVIVDEDNACKNINHPFVDGRKLDLSFTSFKQFEERTRKEIERGQRVPMIAEAVIVFDKNGALTHLQAEAAQIRRKSFDPADAQFVQFLVYHANNKAERFLASDPTAALLVMHVGLNDLLDIHYQIQARWVVSSKRLLADLDTWNAPLASLIREFVSTCDVPLKFRLWSQIIDHILMPLGGRQPIAENNCTCEVCRADLAALVGV